MLILKDLTCKRHLLSCHIGNYNLNGTPKLAEAEEESCEEPQQENEYKTELEFFRMKKRFLLLLLVRIHIRLSKSADFLCLARGQDACCLRIKCGKSSGIAAHHLLRLHNILNQHAAVRPQCRVLCHHAHHQCLHCRGNFRDKRAQRLRLLLKVLSCDAHRRIAVERNPSREHLIEHNTERVDIRLRRDNCAARLFGGEVMY